MGGRAGGGGGRGMGRGAGGGSPLQRLGAAVTKAFYSKGVSDYIDGDNSAKAAKAWANYQNKLADFKAAYKKSTNGGGPAFGDWQGLAAGFANGDYA